MTVQKIIEQVNRELREIPGVVGVVLGGSRARGTHHEASDIDIGIYYDESAGFDLNAVRDVAAKLDDAHREQLITSLGEWGPWVNGGGWLVVQGYPVDFLFRDIHRVAKVIDECLQGNVSAHYQAGRSAKFCPIQPAELLSCKRKPCLTPRLSKMRSPVIFGLKLLSL